MAKEALDITGFQRGYVPFNPGFIPFNPGYALDLAPSGRQKDKRGIEQKEKRR
jgi:hypothetical protein